LFGRSFPLFRLLGFQIKADTSWIFLAALIVWSLAKGYFPTVLPGQDAGTYWQMAVVGAAGLFGSLILHELAHSVVARRYGLPISGITLFLFGGVAEMKEEPRSARVEFNVAVAGPLMSFFLAGLFYLIGRLLEGAGTAGAVAAVVVYLATINIILAVFNLVPAFPLDGGRMFRAFLWWRSGDFAAATRTATASGQNFGLVLIGLGIFFIVTGNVGAGIWQLVLGLFLRAAATASMQQMVTKNALEGVPVAQFMTRDPVTVPATLTIDGFVRDYLLGGHHTGFPVVAEGRPLGYVSVRHAKAAPRDQWSRLTVAEVCDRLGPDNSVDPSMDAHDALVLMGRTGKRKVLVVDRGRLVGLLALSDLAGFLSVRAELEI
jgi:Zn-dependent protease